MKEGPNTPLVPCPSRASFLVNLPWLPESAVDNPAAPYGIRPRFEDWSNYLLVQFTSSDVRIREKVCGSYRSPDPLSTASAPPPARPDTQRRVTKRNPCPPPSLGFTPKALRPPAQGCYANGVRSYPGSKATSKIPTLKALWPLSPQARVEWPPPLVTQLPCVTPLHPQLRCAKHAHRVF